MPRLRFACACCTETAQRIVGTTDLRPDKFVQIEMMRFAKAAKLYSGAADNEIRGIDDPTTDYELAVAMQEDRMVFSFRDAKGRPGTLTLMLPQTISIFEVDPRGDEKDRGPRPEPLQGMDADRERRGRRPVRRRGRSRPAAHI